jgi:hypothetical protein
LILLGETSSRIAELTSGLSSTPLHAPLKPGEWSANDILAHLRACAYLAGNCITAILTRDMPTLQAINPKTWVHSTHYAEQEFQASLRIFTKQRARLLSKLKPLTPEAWSRRATVISGGRAREQSVLSYAQWLASHERTHLKQFKRFARMPR